MQITHLMSMFQEHKFYQKNKVKQNIILICSVLLVLTIIYIQFFSKEMNIKPFGIEALIVKSNSMSPIFNKNDIIIIKEQKEYKIGDIVAYNSNGEIVTHRIIEKNENGFYTKGDNNNTKDEELLNVNNIKGKVIFILYSSKGKQISSLSLF